MSDLSFLYSPNSQAYEAGQRMQQDQLKNTGLDLGNQETAARIPGIQGVSQQQQVAGQNAQAAQQDNQDFSHQEFLSKMDDNQLKAMQSFGQKAGQIGSMIDQVPTPLRAQALPAIAAKFGMDMNNPMISGIMQQAGPDGMGKALTQLGEGIATRTSSAINERAKQQSINQTTLAGHQMAADASKYGSDNRVAAAVDSATVKGNTALKIAEDHNQLLRDLAKSRTESALKIMKPDQRWVFLNGIAPDQRTPEQQGEFERLTQQGYNLKTLGNPALAPSLISGQEVQTPVQAAASAAADITHRGSTGVPQGTLPPGIPAGSKQVGTSEGKPVYQDASGKKYLVR